MQSTSIDGEQVEPTSANPAVINGLPSPLNRLGAGVRIAHQGPMPAMTASSMRPDTRWQSYLSAGERGARKRGGVHTRSPMPLPAHPAVRGSDLLLFQKFPERVRFKSILNKLMKSHRYRKQKLRNAKKSEQTDHAAVQSYSYASVGNNLLLREKPD